MEGSPCAVGSRAFPRRAAADGDNERLLSAAAAAAAARGTMSDRRPSDRVADRTHERVHTRIRHAYDGVCSPARGSRRNIGDAFLLTWRLRDAVDMCLSSERRARACSACSPVE